MAKKKKSNGKPICDFCKERTPKTSIRETNYERYDLDTGKFRKELCCNECRTLLAGY